MHTYLHKHTQIRTYVLTYTYIHVSRRLSNTMLRTRSRTSTRNLQGFFIAFKPRNYICSSRTVSFTPIYVSDMIATAVRDEGLMAAAAVCACTRTAVFMSFIYHLYISFIYFAWAMTHLVLKCNFNV
jgi:hypothetical protein